MKPTPEGFIPPHGGYQKLLAYQKALVIFDATLHFCERFVGFPQGRRSARAHDPRPSQRPARAGKTTMSHPFRPLRPFSPWHPRGIRVNIYHIAIQRSAEAHPHLCLHRQPAAACAPVRLLTRLAGILCLLSFLLAAKGAERGGQPTHWMRQGKYGIFMHYQYRILLGYSIKTRPPFPNPSQMNAAEWNRFVDGFDANGFAQQMAEAKVGWVLFCLDDHYFAWPCAPNKTFSDFTGGDTWSKQDLKRLTPAQLPPQEGILWHGKIYCGNVYHGQGDANQFSDQEIIDWINTCKRQGGVCTLDWPFDPQTGLLKDFGIAQLKRVARAVSP